MKKLFALLAVVSLAAIGCDDKKSTGKPTDATKGNTYGQTNTVRADVTTRVTDTVVVNTATDTRTNTVVATTTVPAKKAPDGPGLPKGDK